jgi:hypothetical protein
LKYGICRYALRPDKIKKAVETFLLMKRHLLWACNLL